MLGWVLNMPLFGVVFYLSITNALLLFEKNSSLMLVKSSLSFQIIPYLNVPFLALLMGHPLGMYATFSEKLTFFTP